jgi:hypothetical protein
MTKELGDTIMTSANANEPKWKRFAGRIACGCAVLLWLIVILAIVFGESFGMSFGTAAFLDYGSLCVFTPIILIGGIRGACYSSGFDRVCAFIGLILIAILLSAVLFPNI